MGSLIGRRVIVTGAATGVGAAGVAALAADGANVVAVYHRSQADPDLEGLATWLNCDLRDREAVVATFAEAVKILGGLDVLLHAAGIWLPSQPDAVDEDHLDFMVATNVKATVYTNQAAFAAMKATGGQILNLGSSEGVRGNPQAPAYSLTKAAVHAWTRSAARAWAEFGVTVNALAPAVDTPGADRLREHLGPAGADLLSQRLKSMIPLGGALGDPLSDLGPVIVFLSGPGAHFITGQLISVDGGLMMGV